MSQEQPTNSSGFDELVALAGLEPQTLPPIKVGEFLRDLHLHPVRALVAPGLLARAIDALGYIDIEKQPEILRPRLRMLRREGIVLYNAFSSLRGQQRMLHAWVKHLRAASHGGEAAKLATVFKGPSGTGKTMLVEIIKAIMNGQIVYHIEGCPVHENPLVLLNLLPPKNLDQLLKHLKLDQDRPGETSIREALRVLGQPCRHCHGLVMDNQEQKDPNLALFNVNVVPKRLSTYSFGVATLTKGTIHSLLQEASRGIADFGELFAGFENENAPTGPYARDLTRDLHDALNDQRIPGGLAVAPPGDDKKPESKPVPPITPRGWEPISVVPIAQVNPGAFEGFKKTLGSDGGKYMRLMKVVEVLHNTSVAEEVITYIDHMVNPDGVHFDPLALTMLAWIAQATRHAQALTPANNTKGVMSADWLEWTLRTRLDDGENLRIKRTYSTGTGPEHWSVKDLWDQFDAQDGVKGLNVPIMLLLLSEIINHTVTEGHKCVGTFEMLKFVRKRFKEYQKSDGFWKDEKEIAALVAEKFLAFVEKEEKPSGAETIYRRELKKIATVACAPDYNRLLESYFQRYWVHGAAAASKKTTVRDPIQDKLVSIDLPFLEKIEKLAGATTAAKAQALRMEVDESVVQQSLKANSTMTSFDSAPRRSDFPVLDRAIHDYLDDEVAKRVERLLSDENKLNEKEKVERQKAISHLSSIGYDCERCRNAALQYIKDYKLWSFTDELSN
jgi:predicted Ser/Thr protein kinase